MKKPRILRLAAILLLVVAVAATAAAVWLWRDYRAFVQTPLTLPAAGIVSMRDFETNEQFLLDASDEQTRRRFSEAKKAEYAKTIETMKTAGIDCIGANTADSTADVLIKYFRYRERRKRL